MEHRNTKYIVKWSWAFFFFKKKSNKLTKYKLIKNKLKHLILYKILLIVYMFGLIINMY